MFFPSTERWQIFEIRILTNQPQGGPLQSLSVGLWGPFFMAENKWVEFFHPMYNWIRGPPARRNSCFMSHRWVVITKTAHLL